MTTKPIIYLAGPYTHADPAVKQSRFDALCRAAAKLIDEGHVVFSPISMTHPIEAYWAEIKSSDWWVDFDKAFMEKCAECHVLLVDGWRESSGVAREIGYFKMAGKPVRFVEP